MVSLPNNLAYPICLIGSQILLILGSAEQPDITYPALYQWGKEAYTEGRWYECVAFMKRALEDHKYFQNILLHCQKRCQRLVHLDPFVLTDLQQNDKNVAENRIFEKIMQNSLCLNRCYANKMADRPRPNEAKIREVNRDFENLTPYNYLQFCYWKLGELKNAVSAAYTYFIRNPNDSMTSDNLHYYSKERDFDIKMYKDLRELEHEVSYEKALDYYEEEDYDNAAIHFELALDSYLKEYEKCRQLCVTVEPDSVQLNSGFSDIYSSITGHLKSLFACRVRCSVKMNTIKSVYTADLLPHIFNHLQFAYWKSGKLRKACEAVATYLLFRPKDQTMMDNKNFYAQQAKLTENLFVPRENIAAFVEKHVLELKLWSYSDDKFRFENNEATDEHPDDYNEISTEIDYDFWQLAKKFYNTQVSPIQQPKEHFDRNSELKKSQQEKINKDVAENQATTTMLEDTFDYYMPSPDVLREFRRNHGIRVLKKEFELNGTRRFLAENLMSKAECQSLMKLRDLSQLGSGYAGKGSPHTKHENFYGLTIGKLMQYTADAKAPLRLAKLFYEKTELARNFVQQYFNLSSHLYVDYTHLACRTSKTGNKDRSDLSHPIHGDNCMLKDGRCDKKFPAFTWRDFSALIYLNDDFDGGEFIFADSNENEAASLKPRCGQMVGFIGSALHGVKAVKRGTRCALALWMTLDPDHQELERLEAEKFLARVDNSYHISTF